LPRSSIASVPQQPHGFQGLGLGAVVAHSDELAVHAPLTELPDRRIARGQIGQAYDGVTEVWFASRKALVKALATPAGAEANLRLAQDETKFIDLPRSSYFLTTEHVLLG
jgi:hypothetical protein